MCSGLNAVSMASWMLPGSCMPPWAPAKSLLAASLPLFPLSPHSVSVAWQSSAKRSTAVMLLAVSLERSLPTLARKAGPLRIRLGQMLWACLFNEIV